MVPFDCESAPIPQWCERLGLPMSERDAQSPLVSIVVPMFRGEKYLRESLDSIRAQTYDALEIICVDDGSPDDCWQIVSGYQDVDSRFRLVRQENKGLSESRNRGILEAKGDFVLFVDQDDGIRPSAVGTLVSLATSENLEAVVFDYVEDSQNTCLPDYQWPHIPEISSHVSVTTGLARLEEGFEGDWWEPRSQLLFLRRKFLLEHGITFFPGILHEDNLFTLSVLLRAKRLVSLDAPLAFVRQTYGSMTRAVTTWHHVWSLVVTVGKGIDEYRLARPTLSLKDKYTTKYVLHNVLNQAVDAAKRIDQSEHRLLWRRLHELKGQSARAARFRFWLSSNRLFGWITKGVRHRFWKFLRALFQHLFSSPA